MRLDYKERLVIDTAALFTTDMTSFEILTLKADSHIACRSHAVSMPFPCHAVPLIHTFYAAPLPCSDSDVSFVNVCVVAGNIRTASPQCNRSSFL